MTEFRVSWTIELDAETQAEAARLAAEIMRDPESLATVFSITSREHPSRCWVIDLQDLQHKQAR